MSELKEMEISILKAIETGTLTHPILESILTPLQYHDLIHRIHLMLSYNAISKLRDANMPIINAGKSNRRKKGAGDVATYMGVKAAVFKIYSYLRRDNGRLSRNLEQ